MLDINHTAFNICLFPPLFFFSALYYTDILSASLVLETYIAYTRRLQVTSSLPETERSGISSLRSGSWRERFRAEITLWVVGIGALLFRQTNIFWIAVFLPGLEVIRNLKRKQPSSWNGDNSFAGIIEGSWQRREIYDPPVREAWLEGSRFFISSTKLR